MIPARGPQTLFYQALLRNFCVIYSFASVAVHSFFVHMRLATKAARASRASIASGASGTSGASGASGAGLGKSRQVGHDRKSWNAGYWQLG